MDIDSSLFFLKLPSISVGRSALLSSGPVLSHSRKCGSSRRFTSSTTAFVSAIFPVSESSCCERSFILGADGPAKVLGNNVFGWGDWTDFLPSRTSLSCVLGTWIFAETWPAGATENYAVPKYPYSGRVMPVLVVTVGCEDGHCQYRGRSKVV